MMKKLNQTGFEKSIALGDSLHCNQAMKPKLSNKLKSLGLRLWRDESGQGTAEYVLILVGVVAVAFAFRKQFTDRFGEMVGKVRGKIDGFIGN